MIAVFGASVTQQKNGYATKLSDKFNCPVRIFGYGGMHLNNAAICFIDKVIYEKPTYCFVDWFSTGYNVASDKTIQYIDTIINKFSNISCKLIFLFLPYKNNQAKQDFFFFFCKFVLRKRGVSFIDIDHEIEQYDIDAILTDGTHTTEYGSNLYSKIIYNKFEEIKNYVRVPIDVPSTKYLSVKKIQVNRVFYDNIKLSGNCEIIGFLLTIGPHSGMVEVTNGVETQICNIWDRWCHYPRQHFNLPMEISENVQINILHTRFDTSSCNSQMDFKKEKNKLIVHDIYYVGNFLNIDNMHNGYGINNIIPLKVKFFGRINHYKNRIVDKLWKNKVE